MDKYDLSEKEIWPDNKDIDQNTRIQIEQKLFLKKQAEEEYSKPVKKPVVSGGQLSPRTIKIIDDKQKQIENLLSMMDQAKTAEQQHSKALPNNISGDYKRSPSKYDRNGRYIGQNPPRPKHLVTSVEVNKSQQRLARD